MKIVAGVVAVLLLVYLHMSGFADAVLLKVAENREILLAQVASHPTESIGIFIGTYIIVAAFAVPVSIPLTMTGGFIFGPLLGVLLSALSATVGATISYAFSRWLLADTLRKRYARQFEKLDRELHRSGVYYMLFLRLVPLFPFFLVNILLGVAGVGGIRFFVTTLFGILPGGFAFAYMGASLARVSSTADVLSGNMLMALVLLGCAVLIPGLVIRFREAKRKAA